MRCVLAVALVAFTGACSNPGSTTASAEAGNAAVPAGERANAASAVDADIAPAVAEPVVTSQASTPGLATVALDGEGLRVFATSNGSSRLIAFGTMRDEAMRALQAALGTASDRGENIDCAASHGTWPNGLTGWFADGKFVGWSVGSANATVATASSLRVGSTRGELEAAYDARIAPSSLGTEFSAGGIAGLLDSPDGDAHVTDLWAGRTCIAR